MKSYVNRDYETILEELKRTIPTLTDKWTDFNDASIGMIWLKLLAGTSAMNNFYIDKQSNENFIATASEAKNIESQLELIGYKKKLRKCSKATQAFRIPSNSDPDSKIEADIIIPKYSRFYSRDNKHTSILMDSITITPNTVEIEGQVYEGEFHTMTLPRGAINDYKYYLPKMTYADELFEMIVDNVKFERVDNAFLEINGGRKFSIHRDSYDSHYILLTHDLSTYFTNQTIVTLNFITTAGEISISPNTITDMDFIPTDLNGREYKDTVITFNKDIFTGGFTENDVLLERAKLQASYNVLDKLVRLEDYENYTKGIGGILDVQATDISIQDAINTRPYDVDLYVLTNTLDPMSNALRLAITTDIAGKQMLSNKVTLHDGTLIPIEIEVHFTVLSKSNIIQPIKDKIQNLLVDTFSSVRFKKPLMLEEISSVILENIPEVYTIKLLKPTEMFAPKVGEAYRVTSIQVYGSIYNASSGDTNNDGVEVL